MNVLTRKTGKKIMQWKFFMALLIGILLLVVLCIFDSILLFPFLIVFAFGLLLLRVKDITRVQSRTIENTFFLVIAVYVEYLWWFSTFLGYSLGFLFPTAIINKYLQKR